MCAVFKKKTNVSWNAVKDKLFLPGYIRACLIGCPDFCWNRKKKKNKNRNKQAFVDVENSGLITLR